VQRRLVGQFPGEQGLAAMRPCVEAGKGAEESLAQLSADADLVVVLVCFLIQSLSITPERMRARRPNRVSCCG
jgi:hypothetical protein